MDETLIYRLNASADGWIRKTFNNSTGSVVKKDEVLATFYAPEFLGGPTGLHLCPGRPGPLQEHQATETPGPDQADHGQHAASMWTLCTTWA